MVARYLERDSVHSPFYRRQLLTKPPLEKAGEFLGYLQGSLEGKKCHLTAFMHNLLDTKNLQALGDAALVLRNFFSYNVIAEQEHR